MGGAESAVYEREDGGHVGEVARVEGWKRWVVVGRDGG